MTPILPVIIEDYISKLNNSKTSIESRQFYYVTLLSIEKEISSAVQKYEAEKKKR
jgi:hypothetical protein